jgi:hypothetical protein
MSYREDWLLWPVLGDEVGCAPSDCKHHNQGCMQLGGCAHCCCCKGLGLQDNNRHGGSTNHRLIRHCKPAPGSTYRDCADFSTQGTHASHLEQEASTSGTFQSAVVALAAPPIITLLMSGLRLW